MKISCIKFLAGYSNQAVICKLYKHILTQKQIFSSDNKVNYSIYRHNVMHIWTKDVTMEHKIVLTNKSIYEYSIIKCKEYSFKIYTGTCVLWTPWDRLKVSRLSNDKVTFGTSTKCVDYAGVLIFKCPH